MLSPAERSMRARVAAYALHAQRDSRELTVMQKRLQGALFGQCSFNTDVPRQIEMYRRGRLKLDELVTRTYSLDEINDAFDDLNAGRNIRGVIRFD